MHPEPISVSVPTLTRPPGSPWPVTEAAKFLSVSKRHLFRQIDANRVKTILIGRRRLIPDAEVQRIASEGC